MSDTCPTCGSPVEADEALAAIDAVKLSEESLPGDGFDSWADGFRQGWTAAREAVARLANPEAAPEERLFLDADRHPPDCDAPYDGEPCTCVSRVEAATPAPTTEEPKR